MVMKKMTQEQFEEISMLLGWPPYDDPSNICYGDAYFAKGLENKWGEPIEDQIKAAKKLSGIHKTSREMC